VKQAKYFKISKDSMNMLPGWSQHLWLKYFAVANAKNL